MKEVNQLEQSEVRISTVIFNIYIILYVIIETNIIMMAMIHTLIDKHYHDRPIGLQV